MLNLIKKIKIIDTSNVSNVIDLDNIMSGVDGASTFGYSLTPTAIQVNDNQRQQYKFTHQLDIRTIAPSSADLAKLAAIEDLSSIVQVSALTENGFLYFNGRLTRSDQYDQIVGDRFLVTRDTPAGYSPSVYAGDNLFARYDVLNPIAGQFASSDIGVTVSGEDFTMTRLTATINTIVPWGFYTLPYPGERFTISFDYVSGAGVFALSVLNSAGSFLVSDNVTVTSGRNSTSVVLPADAFTVFLNIRPGSNIGDTLTIKRPRLSYGSDTTFIL